MPMIPSAILSLGELFRSRATADEWTTAASEAASAAVAVEIRKSRREGLSGRFIGRAPFKGMCMSIARRWRRFRAVGWAAPPGAHHKPQRVAGTDQIMALLPA